MHTRFSEAGIPMAISPGCWGKEAGLYYGKWLLPILPPPKLHLPAVTADLKETIITGLVSPTLTSLQSMQWNLLRMSMEGSVSSNIKSGAGHLTLLSKNQGLPKCTSVMVSCKELLYPSDLWPQNEWKNQMKRSRRAKSKWRVTELTVQLWGAFFPHEPYQRYQSFPEKLIE